MITYLIKKNDSWFCGNCRMKQSQLRERCWFCEYLFSNFETALIEEYEKEQPNG